MSRDYDRFRILYCLYDKHYTMHFEWLEIDLMRMEDDLRFIPTNSFFGETVYLQRKGLIEGTTSEPYPNKVRISGDGIDAVDYILNEYLKFLGTLTDEESKYEYRHLSAIEDSGDDNAVRSQLHYYIKQRKSFFKHFLLSYNIFRQTTFSVSTNDKLESNNYEIKSEMAKNESVTKNKRWDAFISHASEDKDSVARPLYKLLRDKGLEIWYDEFTLKVGDSLRKSIDQGLSKSVCGIVVLSKDFFSKKWPKHELNGFICNGR
jgi:TIR domain